MVVIVLVKIFAVEEVLVSGLLIIGFGNKEEEEEEEEEDDDDEADEDEDEDDEVHEPEMWLLP